MNTNALKKFAQAARTKLISQVSAKLDYVLSTDSAQLREKATELKKLQEAINELGKEQVIEKVSYTWFNRLMALRFMDVNDYQPIGVKVITPKEGYSLPELLDEAKQGHIPEELSVKTQHIFDLLDGKITGNQEENEAFKELLIGACNHLNKVLPFLFERINDYSELLLPDDLTSEFSIVTDIQKGMTAEDCEEVEIIGWLYQFYISQLNDELISSKKKYTKNELAPASQLFTPRWIVEYMVDNTLGQVWAELNPETKVLDSLEYYIKPSYPLQERESKNIEDIKFFDPCVGSGHILAYAFDVFYRMYEEQGYNPTEIPQLIIKKNLYGVDIDQRAAQLASFVLMMKGRQKHRRFLRAIEKNKIQTNISYYQDFEFDNKFNNATALGSLIRVSETEVKAFNVDESSLFGERQKELHKLYQLLGQKYDVVVTNPPYISSSRMEGTLKQYVESNFSEGKSDLFSAFIQRCIELTNVDGMTGYMTPMNWMFLTSFKKFRQKILSKHTINNLVHLDNTGFDGATVFVCTFTLRKARFQNPSAIYIRLEGFSGAKAQSPKTLEAIQNNSCDWKYRAFQDDFKNIPGLPIGYWLQQRSKSIILSEEKRKNINPALNGLQTGDTLRFIRHWSEVSFRQFKLKWFPYNKGGTFRKWYGNIELVINWGNDGVELKSWKKRKLEKGEITANNSKCWNETSYGKQGITWTDVTSGTNAFRILEEGVISDICAPFAPSDTPKKDLIFLNSKFNISLTKLFNPSVHFTAGDYNNLPYYKVNENSINLINSLLEISKEEWNSKENSFDFKGKNLINHNSQDIMESYDLYCQYWKNKFFQLHKNEEELNKQFIEIYGLQDELTPEVSLGDVTILKEETDIVNGELVFDPKEVFVQFISYAVGCMFGRYSLDKEGLILANQGETLEDYLKVIASETKQSPTFMPDDDNIIPILDDEWFEDDIVGRFYEFLKVSFGKENFDKNLAFVEECIGKDVRKFFVKDFYKDHIKRYKKRPIYWMFSSPKGSFNMLIYMHRYTPDNLNQILNGYLREYREKLNTRKEQLNHLIETGSSLEQSKAIKEIDKLELVLIELQEYEREILYPLATKRIEIDLDDGVLVNYNKFGKAIQEVKGLNDKKAKDKVRKFDWINTEEII